MKFKLTIVLILFVCSSFAQSNYTIFGGSNGEEGLKQGSTCNVEEAYGFSNKSSYCVIQ